MIIAQTFNELFHEFGKTEMVSFDGIIILLCVVLLLMWTR